jgi:hypothetical protein
MDLESIRQSYKPERIRLLLVGESPPASGKFFYLKSGMTTYTSRAFEKTFSTTFPDTPTFLKFFRDSDCYLEDLCRTPTDKMPFRKRKAMLDNSVGPLSRRLGKHKP